ncbi:WXG100 family type VII secretion target [Kitasatospora sp. NPDC056531]|uniref:WXG100 family type VII secretion target n=1 Tax=Kitasatospora sp. NPDC056531 TaxID=3345856 RepID=UPI0036D100A6
MSAETNFEGIDHAQLRKMVASTDPTTVLSRGTQLQSAGRVLKELSSALKSHVGNVTWEGPAAENFKTWVGDLQKSAQIISDHATSAGDAMHQAGEALSTAKVAVPEPPKTEIEAVNRYNSQSPMVKVPQLAVGQSADDYMKSINPKWVTATEFLQADAKVKAEHQQAVLQMEKLAQAYSAATKTLNQIPSDVVLPGTPGTGSNQEYDSTTASGGSGGYAGSGGSLRSPRTGSGSTGGSYSPSGGRYGGGSVTPRDPGTSWQDPSNPSRTGTTPPHGGVQLPPAPQDPGSSNSPSHPPSHPSDPVNRPGTGLDSLPTLPTVPGQTGPGSGPLPDGPGTTPIYPSGPGNPGGTPTGYPGGGPITGFPVGGGGGSIPTKSSGSLPGRGGGSIPARTIPFGGGQVPGKSGTPGLPSGTVFGREGGPVGGGRAGSSMGGGMGMHPGMGGGHGVVGGGGGSRGRGLASTVGGTVGGRKGPAAGGEFTPGGTGLRNRAAAAEAAEGGSRSGQNGMMAPGAGGHGGRNERDRRKRADYLHEDEETWTSGTPHSNPDVVE